MQRAIPASMAASIFAVAPPIASTSPRTEREPVNAVSWRMGIFFKAEMIAVATAMDAESPSTPSGVPMNWTNTSYFSKSSWKYFKMIAETFLTASFAIFPS